MTAEVLKEESLDELLFENSRHINLDTDHWFRLRGQSINPMVDAVTPLLGMVNRIRQLNQYDNVSELYRTVEAEIQSIEQELNNHGYENGMVLSFRYILCTFIDEAVMAREWGSQSVWSEHSLLARFHNETWGGEKVFALLDKLQGEPQRYRDILEFIWLCLTLGFQGRYRVMPQGHGEFLAVIRKLHHLLRPEAVNAPTVMHLNLGQKHSHYRLRRQFTLRAVFISLGVLLVATFGLYHHQLNNQTQDVLRQLGELLK